jgi:protein SCO1
MRSQHPWSVAAAVWLALGVSLAQVQAQTPSRAATPAAAALPRMDDVCLTPVSVPATAVRSLLAVRLPVVRLRAHSGPAIDFASSLDEQRPALLNFIFTSCTTVCPPLSQTFAAVQERLGARRELLQMVSVSIDPEHETPGRLRDYAARFGAGSQWRFFTGSAEGVDAVQRAFNVYRPDKMGHTPVTFVRPKGSRQWVRLDGYATPDELIHAAFTPLPPSLP